MWKLRSQCSQSQLQMLIASCLDLNAMSRLPSSTGAFLWAFSHSVVENVASCRAKIVGGWARRLSEGPQTFPSALLTIAGKGK